MRFSVRNFHSISQALLALAAFMALCFTPGSDPDLFFLNQNSSQPLSVSSIIFNSYPDSISIPLKRAGRLIMVEANIDGEFGNLIFDTGATGVVLNKTYFRDHVINDNITSKGITGALDKVDGITIDRLVISDLSFKKVTANLANLGHIENRRGIKILGLFGFGLLRDFEIIIDINNGILRLYKVDKKGNRINSIKAFKPDYTQKFDFFQNIVFLKGIIGGKTIRFCLDTGAETNAISTSAPKAVLKTITITRKSNLQGAGEQSTQVLFGMMNDFMLGTTQLTPMETIITNLDHLNDAYEVHIDGMLGYNFLIKGIICINFEKFLFGISFTKAGEQ